MNNPIVYHRTELTKRSAQSLLYCQLNCVENQYSEVKKRLEEAIEKRDPKALSEALDDLDLKMESGKVPEKDKYVVQQARELKDKFESQKRRPTN